MPQICAPLISVQDFSVRVRYKANLGIVDGGGDELQLMTLA